MAQNNQNKSYYCLWIKSLTKVKASAGCHSFLEATAGELIPLPFPASKGPHISWLMAPSSIFTVTQ